MNIDLDVVDAASLPALAALAQLYQYDFSEIEGGVTGTDGRYRYLDDLDSRLSQPGATAWLFRVVDPQLNVETLAGFALVLLSSLDGFGRLKDRKSTRLNSSHT